MRRIDGRFNKAEAVTCMVPNSGNLGRPGLQFGPDSSVADGQPVVVLLREMTIGLWPGRSREIEGV